MKFTSGINKTIINKQSGIFIFLLLVIIFSCKKDEITVLPIRGIEGSLNDAGLIENFELFEPGDNTVYIDPNNVEDTAEDGTIEHPFNSYSDINWKDSTTYALKRGTVISEPQIVIAANNVILCSYGEGERPIINCIDNSAEMGNRHAIICNWNGINNLTIRDLEISAPLANSCIRILSNCNGVNIINCKAHDSGWGIRSIGNENLFIQNTEVYNTKDDGMFIQNTTKIEISNCYVHHVNKNWENSSTPENEAGGDGIQLADCNNWHVYHNIIDRRNSGNKFCFISNNANQNSGILEFNILYGPSYNGTSAYFHNGDGIIIRYNYTEGCIGAPVYTHGTNFLIHHNIFNGNGGALYASQSAKVYNNLFYNMSSCISGGLIDVSNNIFDTEQDVSPLKIQNLSGSNNLFVRAKVMNGSFSGSPMYLDEGALDFHLLSSSECIDKGIYVGLDKDIDGISIAQGNAPDIGPYEFVADK